MYEVPSVEMWLVLERHSALWGVLVGVRSNVVSTVLRTYACKHLYMDASLRAGLSVPTPCIHRSPRRSLFADVELGRPSKALRFSRGTHLSFVLERSLCHPALKYSFDLAFLLSSFHLASACACTYLVGWIVGL